MLCVIIVKSPKIFLVRALERAKNENLLSGQSENMEQSLEIDQGNL